jgi:hypothetical protein
VLGRREGIALEIVYVDDGSTDATPGILNSSTTPRMRAWRSGSSGRMR